MDFKNERLMMSKEEVINRAKELLNENQEVLITKYIFLEQQVKKQKEVIDKVTNDLQQIIDNVKDRTIISLGQFIPKLEIIQDELNGSNDILKEVSE